MEIVFLHPAGKKNAVGAELWVSFLLNGLFLGGKNAQCSIPWPRTRGHGPEVSFALIGQGSDVISALHNKRIGDQWLWLVRQRRARTGMAPPWLRLLSLQIWEAALVLEAFALNHRRQVWSCTRWFEPTTSRRHNETSLSTRWTQENKRDSLSEIVSDIFYCLHTAVLEYILIQYCLSQITDLFLLFSKKHAQ